MAALFQLCLNGVDLGLSSSAYLLLVVVFFSSSIGVGLFDGALYVYSDIHRYVAGCITPGWSKLVRVLVSGLLGY